MTQPKFILMPQWQGSPSSRAMRIADGAALLREDLPASATVEVAVPLEAGDAMGTPVARLSSLIGARDSARAVLREHPGATPIFVGGDCATSLAGLGAAVEKHGAENLAVLWIDAHPDMQHPSTSPSGAASGMTLRHALGDGHEDLTAKHPALAERVLLVGAREIDPEEDAEIERLGIRTFQPAMAEPGDFGPALEAVSDASHVYVHIDLDALDPAEFSSVHSSVPFGLSLGELTAMLRAVLAERPLAGAAICEFAPASPEAGADDVPSVLRILAALTANLSNGAE